MKTYKEVATVRKTYHKRTIHFPYWILKTTTACTSEMKVDCVWNVMAHAQKPDFVFRRNGRVHLNRWGCQFSRLLATEVCASAVVKLDTPCSEVVWRVLDTHFIRLFPLHFHSRALPCAITFQLDSIHVPDKTVNPRKEEPAYLKSRKSKISRNAL